ncbi:exonuclease 1 [Alligator mississippiensis]|uniref:exonuclease 1 n=1 Tax=Alligator mississippiensis TaxID=8496 RepID=UPI0006ECC7A5|nr:exonuclease 1 [Alligator mississippiensis]
MGIAGLLPFLREAAEEAHVQRYRGQAVAVDTYCWLHKGAYACAERLAKGEPTDFYVVFCMKLVDMLLSFGIKPILVFDGCTLPSKKEVEKTRREKRQASLLRGKQLLREGKLSEAKECFGRSINITHAMAHEVIKAARAQGVDCIVAPYEADAQLAYLNKTNLVQAIITEDSDLLAFGCKKVFLKIDKFGNGLEIDQAKLGKCKQLGNVFTEEKFRYMCILSGCDYLPSIHGIGLAKACKLLKLANNPDIIKIIKKMGQYLKMNIIVSEEYIEGFIRANNTFLYQLVFDPIKRKLVPLNAYGDDIDPETLIYAGQHFGESAAFQIALGNVDVNTMKQIDDYNPDTSQPSQLRSRGWNERAAGHLNSIWSSDYKLGHNMDTKMLTMPLPEKTTTKGIERIVSLKGLKLPSSLLLAKRPRNEELSNGDLLNQYSSSKRPKKENSEDSEPQKEVSAVSVIDASGDSVSKENSNSLPKLRNKFASFLQRKNKDSNAIVVPGTRSRFFCSPVDVFDCTEKEEVSQPSPKVVLDCKAQELKHIEDHVPQSLETGKFTRTILPSPGETQRSCFRWSGNFGKNPGTPSPSSGLLPLHQFHKERENQMVSQENEMARLPTVSNVAHDESDEESCPVPEMECSSQSQESYELSESSLDSSKISQVSNKDSDAEERDCSIKLDGDSHSQSSPPFSTTYTERKNTVLRSKIPGLHKFSSVGSRIVSKVKPLMPAKVSGLSKKLPSVQKKNHCNAENKPGLQATISELWKNFQFKREFERLPTCKKSDPLSPIKDNIQLTPETEEEMFSQLERSHVQRSIFQ